MSIAWACFRNAEEEECIPHITVSPIFKFSFTSLSRLFQLIHETGQSGEPREKPPGTPESKTWLVSHEPRVGLEPTRDTGVR